MITKDKAYGWSENGKFFVSRFPKTDGRRPVNWYHTLQEAVAEAGQRGIRVEWSDLPEVPPDE